MHIPRWAIPAAAALTATGVLVTACGQQQGAGRQTNTSAGLKQDPAAPRQDAGAEPVAATTALEVASVSRLGKVVTDGEGRTLYRFDKDTARPSASSCEDACAKAWPPVLVGKAEPKVDGVDQNLVGKVRRPDGQWQVTLGGWPLYRYAKDASPGDVKGQGVNGTWFAAAPTGKKAAAKKAEQENEGGGERRQQDGEQRQGGEQGGNGGWAGWTTIKVRRDPRLGMIVTDGKGRTMYRFDKDRPRVSNCFGDCRAKWPIVRFNGFKKLKVEGVDRGLVSFIERKDGKPGECQLLINGWPMYYFAKDAEAGDTRGQAVQNVWWVVSPQGKKITTAPGGQGGGDGYGGY
ncbi:SCO0930 family lipoprotein [Actinomadura kijaniata]|uniref:SCO0930 family lipoprotein n=1 Tax=Actinomadura kijaniata TaxID=46161 RepID=UPI003F1D49E8